MRTLQFSLFFIASATLMVELLLTRVFDVILTPNMAYMVIACALFSFGLAGIYVTLRPPSPSSRVEPLLSVLSLLFAVSAIAVLPSLNLLPFDYEDIPEHPLIQALSFGGMYLALVVPFFLSGLIFTILFSAYAHRIQSFYFWDLSGAAVGCVVMIPLLSPIGPGGALFFAAAFGLFASALLSPNGRWSVAAGAVGVVLAAIPLWRSPDYFDFKEHLAKRGVKEAKLEGKVELSRWDPVSKIDVIDLTVVDPQTGRVQPFTHKKHIAYDGGTQSSHIYPFDGNYTWLRQALERGEELVWNHFWHRGVLVSHYLKRDSAQRVLIIGSAAGQETKAALMYGATHVDAVEMVKAVVELGTDTYAVYNGNIFNDPRVHVYCKEGRSFLRSRISKYDIIQIHSNHTSSSIAAGTGAMSPNYLQTADAYREYFTHLSDEGVLHINHHTFPRMITTAALAWKQLGRTEFRKHVIVFGMVGIKDTLPTFMVKMQPWTGAEVKELRDFFAGIGEGEIPFRLEQNPLDPEEGFLSSEFFSGEIPRELAAKMDFHILPATDDKPFFNSLRKRVGQIQSDPAKFTDIATSLMLNSQLRAGIVPMDLVHLIVTALVSLVFAAVFVLLPLYRSEVGRADWAGWNVSVLYFSCLGAGFILYELVFIQIFMKLVGYPVYTYALVIFTLLLGAGVGSLLSAKLGISPAARWSWPFLGILVYGGSFTFVYPLIFDHFLASPDGIRMLVAVSLIFPLGLFLGAPFPLGILAIETQPRGAIAWAWGLNGLFTVVGSLVSVVLGIAIGFRGTLLVALAIYVLAFLAFSNLRQAAFRAA